MKMRVTAYRSGLNFRSEPVVSPHNVLGQLFLLDVVETTGASQDGFFPCNALLGASEQAGFVSAKYLRPLEDPQREALLDQVHTQYRRFERGLGKEHVQPFSGFVGEIWRALGIELDGTDRDQPWSAAAISFIVRTAGTAYRGFRFAAAHSKFTYQAIRARQAQDQSVPFWGMRLHEVKPRPGDIVVRDNPDFAPSVDFEAAAHSDSYRSHSDIIVHVDSVGQRAVAIGGNINDSISISEFDLAPGDFLAPTGNAFALLFNRADDVP
ncbi:DUF2272 domain-containing protein [Ideonella sp. YS5]|uniref:DUF2272 domain-containing protein n=1 Tax=Ideonella sp. YS5 TaxID=3453714 RepID=UPI003EEBDDC7